MNNDIEQINECYASISEGRLGDISDATIPASTQLERKLMKVAQSVIERVGTDRAHVVANLILDAIVRNKGEVRSAAEKQAAATRNVRNGNW